MRGLPVDQGHLPPSPPTDHAGIARPGFDRSMQPAPPGSILDGLQRPSGLNVWRRATIAARSSGEKSLGMNSIFSTPIPCSPVTLPPRRMHSSRISWLATSTRFTCSSSRSSNNRIGWILPSPAWKTLAIRRSWRLPTSMMYRKISGSLVRGTTPSCVQ